MKLKTPYKIALIVAGLAALTYAAIIGARIITYTEGDFGPYALDLALVRAVSNNDYTTARVLLWLGVDPGNLAPTMGQPPLSIAAYMGNERMVRLLLKRGANPDGHQQVLDNFSRDRVPSFAQDGVLTAILTMDRPLCVAAQRGRTAIARILREHGARYEFVDALFLADRAFVRDALANDPALRETLQQQDARMLKLAVEQRNVPAVKFMLELGFDPTEKLEHGYTPLEIAQAMNLAEILTLFEARTSSTDSAVMD